MRRSDAGQPLPPEAHARLYRERVRFWAGLVIAAAGLVAVFLLDAVYLGFTVAMIGTGIAPLDKLMEAWKR